LLVPTNIHLKPRFGSEGRDPERERTIGIAASILRKIIVRITVQPSFSRLRRGDHVMCLRLKLVGWVVGTYAAYSISSQRRSLRQIRDHPNSLALENAVLRLIATPLGRTRSRRSGRPLPTLRVDSAAIRTRISSSCFRSSVMVCSCWRDHAFR